MVILTLPVLGIYDRVGRLQLGLVSGLFWIISLHSESAYLHFVAFIQFLIFKISSVLLSSEIARGFPFD